MSTENQTEPVTEQLKVRKPRSDKGVRRGPYKPRVLKRNSVGNDSAQGLIAGAESAAYFAGGPR